MRKRCLAAVLLAGTARIVEALAVERRNSSSNPARRPSKNQSWYDKRKNQGIKVARKGSKPPKWEKEGDSLYEEIIRDNPYRKVNEKMSLEDAQQLVREKLDTKCEDDTDASNQAVSKVGIVDQQPEPPFLWGGLSVGPVWKQRLVKAGFLSPTQIQVAAFDKVAQEKENLVIASATGSGKSLAYLLPLLTTRQKNEHGRIWVVTPTTELALQLQKVVATMLEEDFDGPAPTVQVLNALTQGKDDIEESDDFPMLTTLVGSSSFMLAGTARAYRQLMDEIEKPIIADKTLRNTAKAAMDSLGTLVFDEADRLFQTEALARSLQERRQQKEIEAETGKKSRGNVPSTRKLPVPLSLSLLKTIAGQPKRTFQHSYTTASDAKRSSSPVRVICASATIGRTLRRQLMDALQTPSMDKAATLVTADVRTKKDAEQRKSSILPSTLQHGYALCKDDDDLISETISTLQEHFKPAPTLIFPGRTGVTLVQQELQHAGFNQVYGLEDAPNLSPCQACKDWKHSPIFVVSEKLVRGLDIPELEYVISLQVPSSAAGYTHLAGRTGRNGKAGIAISFCRPKEVPKLIVIAETLGLTGSFQDFARGSNRTIETAL